MYLPNALDFCIFNQNSKLFSSYSWKSNQLSRKKHRSYLITASVTSTFVPLHTTVYFFFLIMTVLSGGRSGQADAREHSLQGKRRIKAQIGCTNRDAPMNRQVPNTSMCLSSEHPLPYASDIRYYLFRNWYRFASVSFRQIHNIIETNGLTERISTTSNQVYFVHCDGCAYNRG